MATRSTRSLRFVLVAASLLIGLACAPQQPPQGAEPRASPPPPLTDAQKARIDELTGTQGAYTASEDVYKVTFPRGDVKVTVDGRTFQPFLGITSWAAFTPFAGGHLMVMGDLALFEDEVSPVLTVLLDNGLEVTALHNHFFFDRPKVMFMHLAGHGDVDTLASGVAQAIDQVKRIRQAAPQPAGGFPGGPIPESSAITAEAIDKILGVEGTSNDGMYKVTLGRQARMHGRELGAQMGVNTWAAFAGSDEQAFVDGDFAMLESELQPVLKALRAAGIHIVAIHNHMIHEEPRLVFLHYWGKGAAAELARGLKTALDRLATAP